MNYADYMNLVWPLAFILVTLLFVRQLRTDASPIIKGVITGLSVNATRNASQYAIALLFGVSASCSAFIDVFAKLDVAAWGAISWHQYATLWVRVANPFFVAILAYATQNGFSPARQSSGTIPPFAAPATPPAQSPSQ